MEGIEMTDNHVYFTQITVGGQDFIWCNGEQRQYGTREWMQRECDNIPHEFNPRLLRSVYQRGYSGY